MSQVPADGNRSLCGGKEGLSRQWHFNSATRSKLHREQRYLGGHRGAVSSSAVFVRAQPFYRCGAASHVRGAQPGGCHGRHVRHRRSHRNRQQHGRGNGTDAHAFRTNGPREEALGCHRNSAQSCRGLQEIWCKDRRYRRLKCSRGSNDQTCASRFRIKTTGRNLGIPAHHK